MTSYVDGFVLARATLLDTLEVLVDHRKAIVVVGAQAVYLHAVYLHAPGGLAMPQLTLDADLALDTEVFALSPDIARTLLDAGYRAGDQAGSVDFARWCAR